jgi:4-hydroxy-tetrahydrodipicolinate synthase
MITNDDRSRMIKLAVRALRGQLPLIVGIEGIQRTHVMSLLMNAYWNGADVALLILPYAMRPPQQGLVRRFLALSEAIRELPMIIDNNPDRCAVDLLPESFDEIMQNQVYPTIIGIKESSKDCVERVQKYRSIAGNDFKIYW